MMAYGSIAQGKYILVGLEALLAEDDDVGTVGMLSFRFRLCRDQHWRLCWYHRAGRDDRTREGGTSTALGGALPGLAGMALSVLALAGVPPMAGLLNKLFIFIAAWREGGFMTFLVVLGLINSAISLVY